MAFFCSFSLASIGDAACCYAYFANAKLWRENVYGYWPEARAEENCDPKEQQRLFKVEPYYSFFVVISSRMKAIAAIYTTKHIHICLVCSVL